MLTGYTSNLPVDTLLSSGVMYYGKAGVATVVGVTDGAPDFDPGDELGDIMFDQKPSRLKGTIRRVGFTPVIKGTLKEFGPSASGGQIATLETGSTEAIVGGVTTETPAAAGALIAAGSYLVDVRWIFERASGGYAAIYFPFAHVRKWSKKGNDKKEALITFEIEAIGDPVNDLSTAPYAIEIRTALPPTTAPPALTKTLDWAPLVRRADLDQPLTFLAEPAPDGNGRQTTRPYHYGENDLGAGGRITYPKTLDEWGSVGTPLTAEFMQTGDPPQVAFGAQTDLGHSSGPYDNTTAYGIVPSVGNESGCNARFNIHGWGDLTSVDNQDQSVFKRSVACAIRAHAAGDIGKQQRIHVCDVATVPVGAYWWAGGVEPAGVTIYATQDVTLTADYQLVGFTLPDTSFIGKTLCFVVVTVSVSDTGGSYDFAAFGSFGWQIQDGPDTSNWLRPAPWHETYGLLSQGMTQNSWGPDSDDPVLVGAAAKAATAIAAPDSNRYIGGRTLQQFTLNTGDGITTDQPYLVGFDQTFDAPNSEPTGAAWLHWYLVAAAGHALPTTGQLVGYLRHVPSGVDYGPVSLVRDPAQLQATNGGAFYRGRIRINQLSGAVGSGTQSGANYIIDAGAPHGLVVGDFVTIGGSSVAAINARFQVTAVTANTFTITVTAANAADGTWGQTNLNFQPRIVSTVDGLVFNATRAAATPERPRRMGWHHALVPKRTVTGPSHNDAAFERIEAIVNDITVLEGIWCIRQLLPFGLTDLTNLNGNAGDAAIWGGNLATLCFGQSGPNGSADSEFNCDVSAVDASHIRIVWEITRGAPFNPGDWTAWTIMWDNIPVDPNTFPAWVAFDFAVAWHLGAPVAFGVGHGAGTGIQWLNNGDTYLGGTISISSHGGTAWELNVNGDSHFGVAADRDITRESGGWIQALMASKTVDPDPTVVKRQIESHIALRFGARLDYR